MVLDQRLGDEYASCIKGAEDSKCNSDVEAATQLDAEELQRPSNDNNRDAPKDASDSCGFALDR